MTNNDILRRLRYAFDFSDKLTVEMFNLDPSSSSEMSLPALAARLAKEEDDSYQPCLDQELAAFLDGLIVARRGLREPAIAVDDEAPKSLAASDKAAEFRLSRNDVLKKLRIAMNFREQEMLATLLSGGSSLSKAELGALFRKPGHKHYRACGNQVLRNFIKGLTLQLRP